MPGATSARPLTTFDTVGTGYSTGEPRDSLDGFAEKSIENLMSSIEAGRDRPIWRLLTALNIPHVGTHVAQVLANAFGSIDSLMDASEQAIDDVFEEMSHDHTVDHWSVSALAEDEGWKRARVLARQILGR